MSEDSLVKLDLTGDWRSEIIKYKNSKFDDKQKSVYLATLAKTGKKILAQVAAGVSAQKVENECSRDPEFEDALLLARDYFKSYSTAKIEQSAINGEIEQYFDKDTGQVVRERVNFETKLREMILRAKADEEYADKKQVDIGFKQTMLGVIPEVATMELWEGLAAQLDASHEEMITEGEDVDED